MQMASTLRWGFTGGRPGKNGQLFPGKIEVKQQRFSIERAANLRGKKNRKGVPAAYWRGSKSA